MKTVIRTSCEETELEWPDRRLFCLLLWDRWLRRRRLLKSGSRSAVAAKVTPSPHPGHGAYKGTLWDPLAKIAGALVAGNSNLKLGDTPRALAAPNTGYGGRSRAPCSAPHRLRFASPRRWSTRVRVRQVSYALSSTTR